MGLLGVVLVGRNVRGRLGLVRVGIRLVRRLLGEGVVFPGMIVWLGDVSLYLISFLSSPSRG
jgi:hypothetical protein